MNFTNDLIMNSNVLSITLGFWHCQAFLDLYGSELSMISNDRNWASIELECYNHCQARKCYYKGLFTQIKRENLRFLTQHLIQCLQSIIEGRHSPLSAHSSTKRQANEWGAASETMSVLVQSKSKNEVKKDIFCSKKNVDAHISLSNISGQNRQNNLLYVLL